MANLTVDQDIDDFMQATTEAAMRAAIGATTVGDALVTLANPSAVTFPRLNADNSVTALSAANMRTALGATTPGTNLFTAATVNAQVGTLLGEVDVTSFITGGTGTLIDPWTGWDTAIVWAAFTRYRFRSGHYSYRTSPNYLDNGAGGFNPGIELIGEAGTYLHHNPLFADGLCNAFIMDAGVGGSFNWILNMRVENIIIVGGTSVTATSVVFAAASATITKAGGGFNAKIIDGCSITINAGVFGGFGAGHINDSAKSFIVQSHTDTTIVLDRVTDITTTATINICYTKNAFFFRACRNGVFDRLSARDVAEAGLRSEACVDNCLRMFRVCEQEPYQLGTTGDEPFMCRPRYGILATGRDGGGGDDTTEWTMENPVIEGVWGVGIWFKQDSFLNKVIGGTCEIGYESIGVRIDGHRNIIEGMDLEQNSANDMWVTGANNLINRVVCANVMRFIPEDGRTGGYNTVIAPMCSILDLDAACPGIVILNADEIATDVYNRPPDVNIIGATDGRLYTERLRLINSTLAYDSGTPEIDFDLNSVETLTLAGNPTFNTANRAANKSKTIRIIPGGSTRTVTWEAGWKWIGAPAPATIAANKEAMLTLQCFGTAATDILAAYAVEP